MSPPAMRDLGVDVWCLRLAEGTVDPSLFALLSPAEQVRAAAFHAEIHHGKFSTCRAVLRLLLSHYLEKFPAAIEIEYGAFGKPFVKSAIGLQFNIAHSGDMALFAFSDLAVGIDIEQMRPTTDVMTIARRFFSAAEASQLGTLSGEEQTSAFYRCWSRKEAYIKALGEGLSHPLENLQVSPEWLIKDLELAEGYAAALAVRSPEVDLWIGPILSAQEFIPALKTRPI